MQNNEPFSVSFRLKEVDQFTPRYRLTATSAALPFYTQDSDCYFNFIVKAVSNSASL